MLHTHAEICEDVQEEEDLSEILEPPPTTAKIKPDTSSKCRISETLLLILLLLAKSNKINTFTGI